ncbi:hypothetical protein GCM10011506_37410 [Marivirga lumbricoides]|uniref:Uncharacterized protein n=1 Tax=Marivirga lumbricoides TaxID=1046115 RepID=A0ABQ1MXX0_9BACT|nr:hypothetical protein GCM10011506_37410 [Marivirga lumbricoides]
MKTLKLSFFILLSVMLTSCLEDDSDQGPLVQKPTVTYDDTTITISFFTEGNSGAPNFDWNGDQGSFSLANAIEGLDINTTTGVLSWAKTLMPGTYDVQVLATNSAGQTVINMTLNNQFQGVFTGTYDNSGFFEFQFNEEGSLVVRANSESSPDVANGTWTLDDNTIIANYEYEEASDKYSTRGTLTITGSSATYSGNWYNSFDAEPANQQGEFEMEMK